MADAIPASAEERLAANRFLGIQLSSNWQTLVFCTTGIFSCYLAAGIAQEAVFQTAFQYTSFLTFIAKISCSIW
jgi:hypothetical protein